MKEEIVIKEEIVVKTEEVEERISGDFSVTGADVKHEEVIEEHVRIKNELLEIGADGKYLKEETKENDDIPPPLTFIKEEPFEPEVTPVVPGRDPSPRPGTGHPAASSTHNASPIGRLASLYPVNGRFPCPECGKSFDERAKLMVHQIGHKMKKHYACRECGVCFSDQTNLLKHLKNHTRRIYTCEECGLSCTKESYFLSHRRSHLGTPQRAPYTCPDCGRCFARKDVFRAHQTLLSAAREHSCSECGKSFPRSQCLAWHRRMHNDGPL